MNYVAIDACIVALATTYGEFLQVPAVLFVYCGLTLSLCPAARIRVPVGRGRLLLQNKMAHVYFLSLNGSTMRLVTNSIITARNSSYRKVIFSQTSVSLFTGRWG